MKKSRFFIVIVSFITLLALAFTLICNNSSIPEKFKNYERVNVDNIDYILYNKCAIVYNTPDYAESVIIPNTIQVHNNTYLVRTVLDKALEHNNNLKVVYLKAMELESIEDATIFENNNIQVIAYDNSTFEWLQKSNVNVIRGF